MLNRRPLVTSKRKKVRLSKGGFGRVFSSPLALFPSQLGLGGVFLSENQANFEILELKWRRLLALELQTGRLHPRVRLRGVSPPKSQAIFFSNSDVEMAPSVKILREKKRMVLQRWV